VTLKRKRNCIESLQFQSVFFVLEKLIKEKGVKTMIKRIISSVIITLLFVTVALYATGTPSGTDIINSVSAVFSNSGATKFTNAAATTNTVLTVYGIQSATTVGTQFLQPGQTVSFTFKVSNSGNSSVLVNLVTIFSRTNDTVVHNGPWTYAFYTNASGTGGTITEFPLAEDASRIFYLRITAPVGAADGAAITNKYGTILTNSDSPLNPISPYTGMDGSTIFGGYQTLTNNIAIAIIQAPVLILSKTSDVTNSPSYLALVKAGHKKDVVPGSMIIYSISWTNAGSGQIFGLTLTDPVPSDVNYVPGSIRYGTDMRLTASPQNYALINANVLADNGSSTPGPSDYSIRGDYNVTNPSAVNIRYLNPIPGNKSGTVMYKVIVK